MGQPRPLFCLFYFFSPSGIKLESYRPESAALSTIPLPRPHFIFRIVHYFHFKNFADDCRFFTLTEFISTSEVSALFCNKSTKTTLHTLALFWLHMYSRAETGKGVSQGSHRFLVVCPIFRTFFSFWKKTSRHIMATFLALRKILEHAKNATLTTKMWWPLKREFLNLKRKQL